MKEQNSIPTSKVARASSFVKTGLKVGGNYVKYYAKKTLDSSITKDELHADNAEDIYDSLSSLKGSALKVAQMMSMDRNILPKEYSNKFQMSQYSAPPLSGPLVVRTFVKSFGKNPSELFDSFDQNATNAASIGQVHVAYKNGKKLAVKVQYPGVAASISSDLKMVKPFAVKLMGLNEADINRYMAEVENKLLEETDYKLELKNGISIADACKNITHLHFPTYYPEFSSDRIITMDWLEGMHMKDFLATNPSQEIRNQIGQALWDFYEFQIHNLREVHADPHPGNFLFRADGSVGIIDFGCVKEMSEDFYYNYFSLINPDSIADKEELNRLFMRLQFIYESDTPKEKEFFTQIFTEMIVMLGMPFHGGHFDFGDATYFESVYAYGEKLSKLKEIKDGKMARGLSEGLYINRTYYGLYSLLAELKAHVNTHSRFMETSFMEVVKERNLAAVL